ncbi:MAG: glycosyltransferase, partial [Flavobacteriaceae bacterium]|nr:glycosyltransferase [Flavobacteriaceae bacterium]
NFELTIIGDGKELPKLKQLAKKLNIENKVSFTGRIANTDLPELLQKSNIYLSMPITEGVSASLFEAMASNCYPIVTDILGNQSWIKHRENGQLITIDDFEMLANEILWAFENKEIRNTAVLSNRKFVEENANYKTNMKIIANKYHDLINSKNN